MRRPHIIVCRLQHRDRWRVVHRRCNYSAFNGYRRTSSRYSLLVCLTCERRWRTAAGYVETTPDQEARQ